MTTELQRNQAVQMLSSEAVHLSLDIGEQILLCGGEIGRVEDTVSRICRAYGAVRTDVFAITSLIVITAISENGEIITQSRRVYGGGRNMRRLEQMNSLSRRICSVGLSVEEAHRELELLLAQKQKTKLRVLIGSLFAAGSFTVFFGGSLRDCLAALLVSALIGGMQILFSYISVNRILYNLLCAFLSGAAAILTVRVGIGSSVDAIMVGCIMLLIPGISMTSAVENLMTGDTLSGLLGFFESMTVALSLAAGFAVSWYMMGGMI